MTPEHTPAPDGGGHPRYVLLCEPYFGGSHRAWAEGLAERSDHQVRLVTHRGRFWKWRMQGAALTLAAEIRATVARYGRPDVLLVSDMVHVPALLGLARRALADVPVVVYFHENQLTYPTPPGTPVDYTYALANWLSLAAADRVVFNSDYHRRDLLDALPRLLRQFPDHRHTDCLDDVADRSTVLPVGVDADRFAGPRTQEDDGPPVILWNHRWDYDKHPAAFFDALDAVAAAGVAFRLIVAGESYGTVPADFARARDRFGDRLIAFGTAGPDDYPGLLRRADVVVSTARHEFFGVAVVEAITAGALPLLPRRLSYPELVPPPGDDYLYADHDDLVRRLCRVLTDPVARRAAAAPARRYVERFDWRRVAPRYDSLLAETAILSP